MERPVCEIMFEITLCLIFFYFFLLTGQDKGHQYILCEEWLS